MNNFLTKNPYALLALILLPFVIVSTKSQFSGPSYLYIINISLYIIGMLTFVLVCELCER